MKNKIRIRIGISMTNGIKMKTMTTNILVDFLPFAASHFLASYLPPFQQSSST